MLYDLCLIIIGSSFVNRWIKLNKKILYYNKINKDLQINVHLCNGQKRQCLRLLNARRVMRNAL